MSIASEVRRVSREASVPVAEMLYASCGKGSFQVSIVGYSGYGDGTRFTAVRVPTGGERLVGVLLKERFDSHE